jgi:hypothetical protein
MSAGAFIAVLSNIPWAQVVENAPKVADGAARLWKSVTGFRRSVQSERLVEETASKDDISESEVLRAQIRTLDESVKNLQDQMRASSELIKALADQNTLLVQRIELNRVRLLRFGIAAASLFVVLFATILYLLLQQ